MRDMAYRLCEVRSPTAQCLEEHRQMTHYSQSFHQCEAHGEIGLYARESVTCPSPSEEKEAEDTPLQWKRRYW
jgi:hypothetical protein